MGERTERPMHDGSADLSRLPEFGVHVTTAGAWEQISEHGLWPTKHLVSKGTIDGRPVSDVEAWISQRRPDAVSLEHPRLGTVVINHNKPIKPAVLEDCLQNASARAGKRYTAASYYQALNQHVFFWPRARVGDSKDVRSFQDELASTSGQMGRRGEVDRIWVRLRDLFLSDPEALGVTQYNSGSTPQFVGDVPRYKIERSPDMWCSIARWARSRGDIKEVAWRGGIPDLRPYIELVERGRRDQWRPIAA